MTGLGHIMYISQNFLYHSEFYISQNFISSGG